MTDKLIETRTDIETLCCFPAEAETLSDSEDSMRQRAVLRCRPSAGASALPTAWNPSAAYKQKLRISAICATVAFEEGSFPL